MKIQQENVRTPLDVLHRVMQNFNVRLQGYIERRRTHLESIILKK